MLHPPAIGPTAPIHHQLGDSFWLFHLSTSSITCSVPKTACEGPFSALGCRQDKKCGLLRLFSALNGQHLGKAPLTSSKRCQGHHLQRAVVPVRLPQQWPRITSATATTSLLLKFFPKRGLHQFSAGHLPTEQTPHQVHLAQSVHDAK